MQARAISLSLLRIAIAVMVGLAAILLLLKALVGQPVIRSFPVALAVRADPERLRKHVDFLCEVTYPRNSDHPQVLDEAASYIAAELERHGGRIGGNSASELEKVFYTNVTASFGPEGGPIFIIGAHYDVFGEHPGADDNASGVAGLIELGRLLGRSPPPVRVDLVAFTLEEPPFFGSPDMGSAHHARSVRDSHREVLGMISLEMIGYFTDRQRWGSGILEALYPFRGDFVMVVGRWRDRGLARYVKKSMLGAGSIRVRSSSTPRVAGMDASDHRNYWDAGFDAVMIADTAYLRNPNYHTDEDRPDSLDYEKLAEVVEGVFGVAMNLDRLAP